LYVYRNTFEYLYNIHRLFMEIHLNIYIHHLFVSLFSYVCISRIVCLYISYHMFLYLSSYVCISLLICLYISHRMFVYISIQMVACMLCVTIHRRHLMVWKIFAPRFIYEGATFLVVSLALVFTYSFVLRVHSRLTVWIHTNIYTEPTTPKS